MRLGIILVALLLQGGAVTPSLAENFNWMKSKEEMSALSKIGAAVASAPHCNFVINHAGVVRALDRAFGRDRSYPAQAVEDAMFLVAGTIAMQSMTLGSGAEKRRSCAKLRGEYGPNGRSIPDLVD